MIPVLGVPCLNQPDLLYKMLASVTVPVGTVVVIDNGGVVDPGVIPYARVIKPGYNLGVSGSWNLIMRVTPDAPWWFIVNDDLEFHEGDAEMIASHMDAQADEGMVALLGTFSSFGIDRHAVRKAGTFDENFCPAYYEDNDYDYRCRLTGVPMAGLPAGLRHRVSSTLRSSSELSKRNYHTFPLNAKYYMAKWGGPPRGEVFTTPFNGGGDPRVWTLDLDRLADQVWEPGGSSNG